MSVHVSTTTTFEVEIDLSGSYHRGYAPTWDDPGCAGEVDGLDVEGVYALKHSFDRIRLKSKWDRVDILEAASTRPPATSLPRTSLAFIGDEADELIEAEALS